jgi:hypothetical protein
MRNRDGKDCGETEIWGKYLGIKRNERETVRN